ncbi:MAG TPA: immunity 26/phosphotriesterase HocA family protein [Opitutaceae bacterium]
MKLPYSEGTVFLVPLRNDGYARGVVARSSGLGKVLLGYFFGPRLLSANDIAVRDLDPANAILRVRFGDLGLITGEWPIRGRIPNWDRLQWPMPDFVRKDLLGRRKPLIVRYSDTDPSHIVSETPITDDTTLTADSMSGYGAVEIRLTKLLSA